ncbi:MAG TPA: MBL fold metallo-hydrolase [Thermoleophilia bacterium]|nr:MBL fold metallo-hydrolase [Thermoleophilia bacterium]
MEQIARDTWVRRIDAEGFPTVTVVTFTERRAFVIDTLMRPQDMTPVTEFLAENAGDRRVVVVNTHHHWDHVYGNAAFEGGDIVAQRACPRLITAQLATADESIPLPPPEGVPLPTITFGDRLTYTDPDESVHLIHTPGHSEDSLCVFRAESRLLFGGDTVEWPLPNFQQRDGMEEWVRTLRQLKQLPVDLIVPTHGPAMGKKIIDANERYITGVYAAVAEQKRTGAGRHELDVPAAGLLAEGVELDETYRSAHRDNLTWAWDEV